MSGQLRSAIVALQASLLACAVLLTAESSSEVSPVEKRIAAARKRVEAEPKSAQALDELAAAFCRKGRDRNDTGVYQEADQVLSHALQLAPGDYQSRKLQATVLLGKREYRPALQLATELNKKVPDDIAVWALLVDAHGGLGEYTEAERCAQWVLDLRPGSTLGFVKAAGLREVFGDREGAIEFLEEAGRRTSRNDADERAWLLTENARLQLGAGNVAAAERRLSEAAVLFPDSQRVLEMKARLATAKGDYATAATLFDQRYRAVPSAGNLVDWADSLDKNGQKGEADSAFAAFERRAHSQQGNPGNADVQLVFYLADRAAREEEALQLARKLVQERQDTETLHAFAWALQRNGKYLDAYLQMQHALAPGIRDAVYFCHASQIAASSNHPVEAERYRKEASTLASFRCNAQETASFGRGSASRAVP